MNESHVMIQHQVAFILLFVTRKNQYILFILIYTTTTAVVQSTQGHMDHYIADILIHSFNGSMFEF